MAEIKKRFVFLGGIPCFDYMIEVNWADIMKATGGHVFILDNKVLMPVGTIFKIDVAELKKTLYINPMASVEVQNVRGEPYFSMELGGKHAERFPFTLAGEFGPCVEELVKAYPQKIKSAKDVQLVEVTKTVNINMGGNNRNILDAITNLYTSPELKKLVKGIKFEHYFFMDTKNPKFKMVLSGYKKMGVDVGDLGDRHVSDLKPRNGYVFTIVDDEGKHLDRVILSNRSNEESIPAEKINQLYFNLEHGFRRDSGGPEIHLVMNSMTNPEEIRHLPRLLQTAYASGVTTYFCPTQTTVRTTDKMLENKYYATEKERFFQYRRDFFFTSLLPYVKYMILNREELALIDTAVHKRGIDDTASYIAHRMNRGKLGDCASGGQLIVTGGSKGVRYTERLSQDRASLYWRKAHLPPDNKIHFAERRLVCGDDYVTTLNSTLGAGDTFTGLFIGLVALGWDGGHSLRAATLGAQYFIQSRVRPTVADMTATDEEHIRMGTETELVDVVSHHIDQSGEATRYGTISDTVVTIRTSQIHHPFRETVKIANGMAEGIKTK